MNAAIAVGVRKYVRAKNKSDEVGGVHAGGVTLFDVLWGDVRIHFDDIPVDLRTQITFIRSYFQILSAIYATGKISSAEDSFGSFYEPVEGNFDNNADVFKKVAFFTHTIPNDRFV